MINMVDRKMKLCVKCGEQMRIGRIRENINAEKWLVFVPDPTGNIIYCPDCKNSQWRKENG